MIGALRGSYLERWGDAEVLIDVAGVGYRVSLTPAALSSLGAKGSEVFLYIHHHRREDAETLFGFIERDELVCFEALLAAHGVGPSLAQAMLSVHPPAALRRAVAEEDVAALCLVPGVGKKTAARLLIELKSRLDLPEIGDSEAVTAPVDSGSGISSAKADVRDALTNLGYQGDEITAILHDLPADGDASVLLRLALQRLAAS